MAPQRRASNSKGKNPQRNTGKTPWTCLECEEAIVDGEMTIECHKCKSWCHKQCSDLNDEQYTVLARGGESMLWQYGKCIAGGDNTDNVTRTEAKLDRLMQLFHDMVQRLDQLEKSNNGKNIDDKIEEAVERKMTQVLDETKEKEKRKLNIIVANLPESREGSVEERNRDDTDRVRQLVSKTTDVPLGDIDAPIRLGQIYIGNNTRPRLLRMVVKSVESKEKIMRNVYGLNDGVPFDQRIHINNDNTPQERAKYKALKEENNDSEEG